MLPAHSPTGRKMFLYPFRPFRNHEKSTVGTLTHHSPRIIPPLVRIRMKEIRRKAGIKMGPAGDFVASFIRAGSENPDREVEAVSFLNHRWIFTDCFVPTVHIAVKAPCTYFGAAMPQVPVNRHGGSRICILFRKK